MGLGGVISNLLSLGAKLLPTVVASAQAPSSSSNPPVDQNHHIEAELKKLMRMLERIKARLYDAEQREITDLSVKLWLKELKGVAYDAEDVLGEYLYEVLRAQVEAKDASPPDSRKRKLTQLPCGMLDQIQQIRSSFDEIANDRIALQLSEGDGPKRCNNELQIAPTSHFVVESNIFGREREKEKLIDLLSLERDIVSVVTIVGMGGIGKTTIAQLAYNDKRIKQRFDKYGWICVSEDFNVERLTKESLESITGNGCDLRNLSALQEKIRKEISGKKVVLVLDDVWNEKKSLWDSFQAIFMSAAFAKILVTTRNDSVARIMQTEPTFNIGYLLAEQSWLLFEHYAFGGVKHNMDPKLVEIGKQIMNKCGMLPLAVKSIACLLRHEGEEESWTDILESELWESNARNEIFPPLQISYERLPTYLKSCFLYCSMFPKDYKYVVGDLVKLWMYQGLIEPKGNKTAEQIGFEYAEQLFQRSLFEREGRHKLKVFKLHDIIHGLEYAEQLCQRSLFEREGRNKLKVFKLHDIVHDLARLNSENNCYSIEVSKLPIFPNILYHMYIDDWVNLRDRIPSDKFTTLRTLFIGFSVKNFFNTFEFSMAPKLRALDIWHFHEFETLRALDILVNQDLESLSSIGNLKHLRYLSLRYMFFKMLPECICSLYSLQHLTLKNNNKLKELPTKIGNLIRLEELIIDHCYNLKELPRDMGSLPNLRSLKIRGTSVSYLPPSLSKFVGIQALKVELRCQTIGWLRGFPDLGGTLCLYGLKNISNLVDVQCANLVSMCNLENLILYWDDEDDYWDKEDYWDIDGSVLKLLIKKGQNIFLEDQKCFSVMDSLQPHPNLSKLQIMDYSGITFPEWIGSLLELQELEIAGCYQLVSLHGIQKLKSLVKLSIHKCYNLCSFMGPPLELTMCTGEGSYGSSLLGLTNLASLRSLKISHCIRLQVLVDELLPAEPCNILVSDCPGLWKWCLQHGINYKVSDLLLHRELLEYYAGK